MLIVGPEKMPKEKQCPAGDAASRGSDQRLSTKEETNLDREVVLRIGVTLRVVRRGQLSDYETALCGSKTREDKPQCVCDVTPCGSHQVSETQRNQDGESGEDADCFDSKSCVGSKRSVLGCSS